jgi:hypothetical protein
MLEIGECGCSSTEPWADMSEVPGSECVILGKKEEDKERLSSRANGKLRMVTIVEELSRSSQFLPTSICQFNSTYLRTSPPSNLRNQSDWILHDQMVGGVSNLTLQCACHISEDGYIKVQFAPYFKPKSRNDICDSWSLFKVGWLKS